MLLICFDYCNYYNSLFMKKLNLNLMAVGREGRPIEEGVQYGNLPNIGHQMSQEVDN